MNWVVCSGNLSQNFGAYRSFDKKLTSYEIHIHLGHINDWPVVKL